MWYLHNFYAIGVFLRETFWVLQPPDLLDFLETSLTFWWIGLASLTWSGFSYTLTDWLTYATWIRRLPQGNFLSVTTARPSRLFRDFAYFLMDWTGCPQTPSQEGTKWRKVWRSYEPAVHTIKHNNAGAHNLIQTVLLHRSGPAKPTEEGKQQAG